MIKSSLTGGMFGPELWQLVSQVTDVPLLKIDLSCVIKDG